MSDTAPPTPKILLFINSRHHDGVAAIAVAEDGEVLDGHFSSDEWWAKQDMEREHKLVSYAKHYPDGYELVWLNTHDEIKAWVDRWTAEECSS